MEKMVQSIREKAAKNNNKRNSIYSCIYKNRIISKPEIASALELSLPTVSQYVADLKKDGLIFESGILDSTGGRKPVAISCNPLAAVAIGLSLYPKNVSVVVLNLYGEIIYSQTVARVFKNDARYSAMIEEMVDQAVKTVGVSPESVLGVGVAIPGIIGADKHTLIYSHVLPRGLDFRNIGKDVPYSRKFINDATAAGYAEIWKKEVCDSAAFLSLSETVGGAIIMNGTIFPGLNNRSGEFGHLVIDKKGPRCKCGQKGCLGCYCSSSVLTDNNRNLTDFFDEVSRGEPEAVSAWNKYIDSLASGIQLLHVALDCDVIVGGDVGGYVEQYIEPLKSLLKERNPFEKDASYVRCSKVKSHASAVGSALQFITEFLDEV